jgi:hypothetical protein
MADNSTHRQHVLEAVRDVTVEDFGRNFEPIYERAHQMLRDFPLRVDEEIRNVLNHLRLAYDADTFDEGMLNVARGRRHIYFAIYLCFSQMIEHETKLAERHLGIPNERTDPAVLGLHRRLAAIKETRNGIPKIELERRSKADEIEEDTNRLVETDEQLEKSLLELNTFYADLREAFPSPIEIDAPSSLATPARLQVTLDKLVLIEQQQNPDAQISELESSILRQQELLAEEEVKVRRRQVIFLVIASLSACTFLVVGALWANHPQVTLLPVALLLAIFFCVSAFVLFRIFQKHKSRVSFESELLKRYLKTRLELLNAQLANRNRSAL